MQGSSLVSKFETRDTYNSLDRGEEAGDAVEEEVEVHAGAGEHVGAETDETAGAEEEAGAPVGSGVDEGVETEETEETMEKRRTASPGVGRDAWQRVLDGCRWSWWCDRPHRNRSVRPRQTGGQDMPGERIVSLFFAFETRVVFWPHETREFAPSTACANPLSAPTIRSPHMPYMLTIFQSYFSKHVAGQRASSTPYLSSEPHLSSAPCRSSTRHPPQMPNHSRQALPAHERPRPPRRLICFQLLSSNCG